MKNEFVGQDRNKRGLGISARVAGAALASVMVGSLFASPALAADAVTQEVTGGSYTASVADLALTAVSYSHSEQTQTGTMVLSADDSTGTDAGWNVTVMTSDFAKTGGGTAIPAANFALTSAAAPTMTAGQAIDATGGPKVPTTSPVGTLDAAKKVEQADAGFGKGTYAQDLGVSLTIPAQTLAGTYTGTLTTSITSAP